MQSNGKFVKAKGHLIAQGFTQCPRLNYYEITSPILKLLSLRVLLAIDTALNWEIELITSKMHI
jgi:hypothetical protein